MAFQNCIDRIVKAAGRPLTDGELEEIVKRVSLEVQRAARRRGMADSNGMVADVQGLPPDLFREAADATSLGLLHDAQKKRQRVALAAIKHADNEALMAQHGSTAEGLGKLLERVDGRIRSVERTAVSGLIDTLNSTSPRFFGLIEDVKGVRDLVREMFGEKTGNEAAAKGAKAWGDVAEGLRLRFNTGGGDVGILRNWGMPQAHDLRLVKNIGQQAWVDYVVPRLDRAKYLRDDGGVMSETEVRDLLGAAWQTIATDGTVNIEPGKTTGKAVRAKRNAEHRIIHFKGADNWLDYHNRFAGRSVFDSMIGHVHQLSRDIGLIEALGPNSAHEFQFWRDTAQKDGARGLRLNYLDNLYSQVDGSASQSVDAGLARFGQGVRSLQVAAKLGGAVLSSITDFATAAVTVGFNHLPPMRYAQTLVRSLNPLDRADIAIAQRAGLGLETLIGEINRWGGESLGHGFTGKLASTALRASGLNALTEANRRAFGVTMAATLGDLTRKGWGDLHAHDRAQLKHYGIEDSDWAVLQKIEGEDWGGGNNRVLTVSSIRRLTDEQLGKSGPAAQAIRDRLSTRILDMVLSETDYAVVTPGAKERALMVGMSAKKGTAGGEFARTVWLFKSFPVAVISKHWMRGWGMNTAGGRAAYLASFAIGTSLLGALAMQLKDVTKGKDPRDMTTPAFWGAAFAQGGGLGIFGDYLFTNQSRFGRSVAETAAGPVFGGVLPDLYDLTIGNIHEAAAGEPTHAGAEALRFAQGNTPLVNVWYLRAAMDHLVFQQMQEYLSPGFLDKMRQRQLEATGQGNWWESGQAVPNRAPQL